MGVFKIQKEFLLFKFKTCRYKKKKNLKRKEEDELYSLIIINNNKKSNLQILHVTLRKYNFFKISKIESLPNNYFLKIVLKTCSQTRIT